MTDPTEATATHPIGVTTGYRPVAATLHLVFPQEMATRIPLDAVPKVMGRSAKTATLRVDHSSVSRRHLALAWDPAREAHCVSELGSRNGSRIDGQPIGKGDGPTTLGPGSIVRMGGVLFVYEPGAAALSDTPDVDRQAVPGSSACMAELRDAIRTAAPDPAAVLLVGETGTGKEFIARELHRLSGRKGELVAINCAALSPTLVESQLFGHRKGAFTGAETAQRGLLEAADGGTIFLDEVGELPLAVQPKLLRVLQESSVLPVGETQARKVDLRIVSATLRDLQASSRTGEFRLDLYARISPIEIRVPALRERRADILSWIEELHARWYRTRSRAQDSPPSFEADAVERLLLHPWPENIRALERIVQHHCSRNIWPYDAPPLPPSTLLRTPTAAATFAPQAPAATVKAKRRARPTKEELSALLEEAGGSVRAVAKQLDRERRQIYRWMERYGLREK